MNTIDKTRAGSNGGGGLIIIIKNKAIKYTACQMAVNCCGQKLGRGGHGEGSREASILSRVVGKGHILKWHLLEKDLKEMKD